MEKKFRFWSKQQKKFVYPHIWVQSNNVLSANAGEGEDIIIQQWTGLQDKNKKDIYEGDIVRYDNKNFEIKWERARWICPGDASGEADLWDTSNNLEKIGIIFKNPELLKNQNENL